MQYTTVKRINEIDYIKKEMITGSNLLNHTKNNESFGIINHDMDTNRKSIFLNEFCESKSKTTCSSRRQSRGVSDNYYSSEYLTRSDSIYKRDYPINDDKSWKDYGNEYIEYCPISLSEEL
jgi:hypothetical protein